VSVFNRPSFENRETTEKEKIMAKKKPKGGPVEYRKGMSGRKIRSKGKGRGLGRGKGKGPIGKPIGAKR